MIVTVNCDNLIVALRSELEEYGGLLSLFNDQQKAILDRKPDTVLAVQESILAQLGAIDTCRKYREEITREIAALLGQPTEGPLRSLIDSFPEEVRPLLHALIDEVNRLILRTRRRGQQNQMLLARSIEVSQQILQKLNPGAVTRTYSRRGGIRLDNSANPARVLARS